MPEKYFISSIVAVNNTHVVLGSMSGDILVYDAEDKSNVHNMKSVDGGVVSLNYFR